MNATRINEEWRPVIGYEGAYEVSSIGRVRSLDRIIRDSRCGSRRIRGQVMTPTPTPPGNYLSVMLRKDGAQERRRIHVLVLESFVGPRPSPEIDACHNNSDPYDLRVENLRWDTKSANAQDSLRAGTNFQASKTHCKRGHEFTASNTYILPKSGGRVCRTCVRNSRGTKVPRV